MNSNPDLQPDVSPDIAPDIALDIASEKIDVQPERIVAQSDWLANIQRRMVILFLVLACLYLALQVAGYFADIIRILGISLLLSYLFINAVDWLEKPLGNRAGAIFVVYLTGAIVTTIGIIIVVPASVYQITQFVDTTFNQIPELSKYITSTAVPFLEEKLHAAKLPIKAIDILNSFLNSIPRPDPSMIFSRMSDVAMSTMTWLLYGLSIVIVSFYFLLDGVRMRNSMIKLFPTKYQETISRVVQDIDLSLQAFFRGQIVLGLLFGLVMFVVYMILGVKYALVLGIFLAAWEIVPVIGPPIGFIPAFIAVAVHGMDNFHVGGGRVAELIVVTVVFNLMQWLKDNLIAPRYIGNVIGLHPVVIFIAIMIGARLDGMLGIIFALPVACAVNVIFCFYFKPHDQTALEASNGAHAAALNEPKPSATVETASESHAPTPSTAAEAQS